MIGRSEFRDMACVIVTASGTLWPGCRSVHGPVIWWWIWEIAGSYPGGSGHAVG